jgi:hypothetical protein
MRNLQGFGHDLLHEVMGAVELSKDRNLGNPCVSNEAEIIDLTDFRLREFHLQSGFRFEFSGRTL